MRYVWHKSERVQATDYSEKGKFLKNALLQTHQFKPRQSRRKYRAVEAADLVVLLHVT
jgi:hypothetical protein